MKKTAIFLSTAFVALSLASSSALAEGDAAKGATLAESKCTTCHDFGDKLKKKGKIGPSLAAGISGKPAGKVEGFAYSPALLQAATGGLVWTDEQLDALLTDPKKLIKGTKMMAFPGMKEAGERADIIAFLKTL